MVFSVVMVAGLETTRNAIAGGILALIQHPEQWQRLQQDASLINPALDEILRRTSPTLYNRRTATRDVVIGDRLIRRGGKVTLWWASANRDDAYYEQPFEFDIGHQKNRHNLAPNLTTIFSRCEGKNRNASGRFFTLTFWINEQIEIRRDA